MQYLKSTRGELAGDIIHHSRELVKAKSRRLSVLELQQAKQGINTAPAIILEIQDLKGELDELWATLREIERGGNEKTDVETGNA